MASTERRVLSAVLFVNTSTIVMDVYSSVHSSPFTVEQVSGNPEKQDSCRKYIKHAMLVGGFYGLTSALIAGWPEGIFAIAGTLIAEVYMGKLYTDAMKTAMEKGSITMNWSGSN